MIWKRFVYYTQFVKETHLLPMNSPHEGQWFGPLIDGSLLLSWKRCWKNSQGVDDFRGFNAYMSLYCPVSSTKRAKDYKYLIMAVVWVKILSCECNICSSSSSSSSSSSDTVVEVVVIVVIAVAVVVAVIVVLAVCVSAAYSYSM